MTGPAIVVLVVVAAFLAFWFVTWVADWLAGWGTRLLDGTPARTRGDRLP